METEATTTEATESTTAAEAVALTVTVNIENEFFHSVFTTALEGGIGYWSECTKYRWALPRADRKASLIEDYTGFYALITDTGRSEEDDEGEEIHQSYRIDREVVIRGIRSIAAGKHEGLHRKTAARIVQAAISNDAGELDASDADCVIQIGLFGEVIYG